MKPKERKKERKKEFVIIAGEGTREQCRRRDTRAMQKKGHESRTRETGHVTSTILVE